jgi:hypothetical protein
VLIMKKRSKHTDVSGPQTVTPFIKLQTRGQTIQIGFTDQQVSPHAGLATFIGFLHWHRFGDLLGKVVPYRPGSNAGLDPAGIALGFMLGMVAGAIRGMVAELIEVGADLSGNPIPALTGRAVVSMTIDMDATGGVVMDATAVKEVGTWTGDLTLGDSQNPPVFHPSGGGVWVGTVHSKGTLPPGNSTGRGTLSGILGKVEGMEYRLEGEAPTFGLAVYDVQLLSPRGRK